MKKIIDISPPESRLPKTREKEKKKSFSPLWKILIVLGVIFGGMVFLTNQSRLHLKIQPHLESLSFEETFEARIGAKNIELEEKIIPGEFFTREFEKWEKFESTGRSQKTVKAEGKIRVYNNHTPPTPVTLRAQTRFLSAEDGKIFRSPKKIYIPSARTENGRVIPGVAEIEVIAQEAGEDYNIGPSKFSVPGLAGTSLYYTVYAESDSPMTGGFKREIKIVSKEDIEKAEVALGQLLFQEAKGFLKNEIPGDFILLDDAILEESAEVHCLQKPETETSEFSCQGKIKIKGLGFKVSELKELVKVSAKPFLSPSKILLPETLNFEYQRIGVILGEGKMVSDLKIEAKIYKEVPVDTLSEQIAGYSKQEIEEVIFGSYPQVRSIEMKFWPFWVKGAPKNPARIRIELTF